MEANAFGANLWFFCKLYFPKSSIKIVDAKATIPPQLKKIKHEKKSKISNFYK